MAIITYSKGDSRKLSENFRAREFDCPGKGCCSQTPIDEALVQYLQRIRTHFGKPIFVLGYRCAEYNAKTPNAAPNSRHTMGMAADFSIDGVAPEQIAKYAESIGVQGIGLYDSFVHIDTREQKAFWFGHEQAYRATFGGDSLREFILAVQRACGAQCDGIAGPETLSRTVTLSAQKNRCHPVVKAVQKRLQDLGYTQVGEADGIAGPKFTAAVKAYQHSFGGVVDGEITAGRTTWKKLLGMA